MTRAILVLAVLGIAGCGPLSDEDLCASACGGGYVGGYAPVASDNPAVNGTRVPICYEAPREGAGANGSWVICSMLTPDN